LAGRLFAADCHAMDLSRSTSESAMSRGCGQLPGSTPEFKRRMPCVALSHLNAGVLPERVLWP
jgi:hypothetical protein